MTANEHVEIRLKATINKEEPSEELLQWAKENINENPDMKDQSVADLRDLIYEKGECTPHRMDDEFLIRFLRARHFAVNKAHKLMFNYYEFKASAPEYFENIDIKRLRSLAKTLIISVPPYRDQHGRRMMILKIGNWDPNEFTIPEMFQLCIGLLEISVMEPQCQIKGAILIVDLGDLALNMAWYMTPNLARHFISLAMTSFPMRLEAVHFLYGSWVFDTAWNILKPLIPNSVKDRIHFHTDDLESLHAHVDIKYLPKRYGGIHLDYPLDIWFEDVVKKDPQIVEELVSLGYAGIAEILKEEENKEAVRGS